MKPATRERQERYIRSFDGVPSRDAGAMLGKLFARHGLAWLTDDQIADMTDRLVADARFSQGLRIRNRSALRKAS